MPADKFVLVVDDDSAMRDLLCQVLEMDGYRTGACANGLDALRAAKELHPTVLTLDLRMPGIDGIEVIARLAGDQDTAYLPVIVISGYASDPRLRRGRQVKTIISKPFDLDYLLAEVSRVCAYHRHEA